MSNDRTEDGTGAVLHSLELRKSTKSRGSQPDRYAVDLVAQASWENPYRVRMEYSGEGTDPGSLSWEFPTEPAALQHVHVLVTRQERVGYKLTRVPQAHPYRAWLAAKTASDEDSSDETGPQATLF